MKEASTSRRILLISLERRIFEPGAPARDRLAKLGSVFDKVAILVPSLRRHGLSTPAVLAHNVTAYPTHSRSKIGYFFDALRVVRRELFKQGEPRFDVISTQDPYETGLIGLCLRWRYGKPLHVQVHTDFLSDAFQAGEGRWLTALRRRTVGAFVLRRAQGVRAVSSRIAQDLMACFPNLVGKVTVLPIFTDRARFEAGQSTFDLHEKYPQFSHIVLMVSRLSVEKDIPLAFKAFARLLKHQPRAGLVIVGDGSERQMLEERVQREGLVESVVFEGWQNDTVSYYKTADVFLHTSQYEGYGQVFVEAFLSGLPIVATNVGVVSELPHGSARLCGRDDDACLTRQLIEAFSEGKPRTPVVTMSTSPFFLSQDDYLKAYQASLESYFVSQKI